MEIQILDNGVVLATISFADGVKVAQTEPSVQPKTEALASAKPKTEPKVQKKLSKAENGSRYAKLNAQLAVASKASKNAKLSEAEKADKIALALAKAMDLATKPTVWQKDVNRILSRAEEYGLSLS